MTSECWMRNRSSLRKPDRHCGSSDLTIFARPLARRRTERMVVSRVAVAHQRDDRRWRPRCGSRSSRCRDAHLADGCRRPRPQPACGDRAGPGCRRTPAPAPSYLRMRSTLAGDAEFGAERRSSIEAVDDLGVGEGLAARRPGAWRPRDARRRPGALAASSQRPRDKPATAAKSAVLRHAQSGSAVQHDARTVRIRRSH